MKGTRLGTPEQQIAALEKNIEIMEANEKVTAKVQYQNGREDEREAILSYLRWMSCESPERAKWVRDIEAKKHLKAQAPVEINPRPQSNTMLYLEGDKSSVPG